METIRCPQCSKTSTSETTLYHCPHCGASLRGALRSEASSDSAASSAAAAMVARYTDAYRVGKVIVTVGGVVKKVGVVAGVAIMLAVFSMVAPVSANAGRLIGVVMGCLSGFLIYVFGMFVAAQGQLLQANLDIAVHSSPFLTNEQKGAMLSL